MYSGNMAPWEQYPKHLRFSEVVNPLQVLIDFFNSGKPKSHRRDLKLWRYYVTKDKGYKDRHGAGHILFIHDGNVQLMEAMHLLLISDKDRWPRLEDVTEEQLATEKETWPYFPKNLSPEELANPYRAVRKCFRKISPQQYRDFLHEWLQAALYNSAADETNTPAEIIDVYENIRKLYSAAWLIHQRETGNTFLRRSLDQDKVDTAIQRDQITEEQVTEEHKKGEPEPNEDGNDEDENNGDEPDDNDPDEKEQEAPKHTELVIQGNSYRETELKEIRQQEKGLSNTNEPGPLKDLYPNPTEEQEIKLQVIKDLIVIAIPSVRLIFLLAVLDKPLTFYLVILFDDKEKKPEHEIANKIEDNCRYLASVFAIVHKLASAKEALEQGRRFWHYMLFRSTIVYEHPGVELPAPVDIEDQVWMQRAEQDWNRWGMQGKAFFKGAGYYIREGEYGLAVFSLHQAVESSLLAVIKAVLGYRLSAHNLSRMIRITLLFTNRITRILSLNTPDGLRLFTLLQNGYSEARYKSGYQPDEASVRSLKVRVEVLLAVVEDVYKQFVDSKKHGK